MTTLATMTDQVLADLSSYVHNQESITVLTDAIDASALSLPVDDTTAVAKGLVEIGDELVYVKRVNTTTGEVLILPGTRGFRSTAAASHAQYTLVRNNPMFPRSQVQRAINDTVGAIPLYALRSIDITFDGFTYLLPLPAGVIDVVGVTTELLDSSGTWPQINRWRLDTNYWTEGATEAVTALELLEAPTPGRTVRVQYIAQGAPFASPSDAFTVTGLPPTCEDVIRLGAMWRLVATLDPGKVTATSPSADAQNVDVPVGKASDISKYLFQLFSNRLAEEKAKQADNFLASTNYQG